MVGTSTRAAVLLEGAQGSVDQAAAANMPFLVARSEYSDYPSAQSSQLSGQDLVARCTDVDNEESSVVEERSSGAGQAAAGWYSRNQSLRRETQ